jgi:hypothetical protein
MDTLSGGNPRTPGLAREEVHCPSCARRLVLRSGPAITPHYAHRPRQSCRNRPGHAVTPLRLEQLTLFEMAFPAPAEPIIWLETVELGVGTWPDDPTGTFTVLEAEITSPPAHRPARPRRRRRAWLPRLIRWVKARRRG